MSRFLNVGIIQQKIVYDTTENLKYIEEKVNALMSGYHKPELIVGVEGGIGYFTPQPIPGTITNYLCNIAKKYGIYFIPGTMYEVNSDLPEGYFYNSAPIINPKGEIIAVYRKMAPWKPSEQFTAPGKEYIVFEIPEKNTKVGVMICYDLNFPEIARNLTLMGAEVLVKLTQDPEELYELNKPIHFARALENQAYLVSTNTSGTFSNFSLYGKSLIINPEGRPLWEAGHTETIATVTLNLDLVNQCREYGTIFMDHYIKHLKQYNFPMPYSSKISEAPVYNKLTAAPNTVAEYNQKVKEIGIGNIGKNVLEEDMSDFIANCEKSLEEFLKGVK